MKEDRLLGQHRRLYFTQTKHIVCVPGGIGSSTQKIPFMQLGKTYHSNHYLAFILAQINIYLQQIEVFL